jgi:hypothetical protein
VANDLEQILIRVDGLPDVASAAEVVSQLGEAGLAAEVRIEFGPKADCHLVPLALVGDAIARRGAPVRIDGLSQHQLRVLRYLGVTLLYGATAEPSD